MSLLSKAVGALSRKDDVPLDDLFEIARKNNGVATVSGESVNITSAMKMSGFFACTRLISYTIASLPVDLLEKQGATRVPYGKPVGWCPRPNLEQSWPEFAAQAVLSLVYDGNLFLDVHNRGYDGSPTSLWVIPPSAVVVGRRKNGKRERFYTVREEGVDEEWPASDILHIRALTIPGHERGVSVLEAARQEIGLGLASQKYLATFYANGATVSSVLEFPAGTSKEDAKDYIDAFRDLYSGSDKSHKVAGVVGATYRSMGITHEQAQFLESRDWSVVDIARLFGIPPHRVGEVTKSTSWGTGVEVQNIALFQDAIQPYVTLLEAGLSTLLPGSAYLRFNLNALLRADSKARAEFYWKLWQMGAISADQINAREDQDPLPEGIGDFYFTPANMLGRGPGGRVIEPKDASSPKDGDAT